MKLKFFLFFAFSFLLLAFSAPVYAAVDIGEFFGFGSECPSTNPSAICSLGQGTSRLVRPTFSLAAVIIVIYFLVGAYKYLTSGGNKEEVEGARQMITHAIIGFILLMFAFLVLQFLLARLFNIKTGLDFIGI